MVERQSELLNADHRAQLAPGVSRRQPLAKRNNLESQRFAIGLSCAHRERQKPLHAFLRDALIVAENVPKPGGRVIDEALVGLRQLTWNFDAEA